MPISHPCRPRRGSLPVAGWQRQQLGHTDRLRIMDAARRYKRATHCRGSGWHGGPLRDKGLRVLWTLLYRGWGRAGAGDPALAQIAQEARLARSTVQHALDRLEVLGCLLRVQRGAAQGRRWVQATNAYLFRPPTTWASDTGNRKALESDSENKAQEEAEWSAPPPITEAERRALLVKWGLAGGGEAVTA